MPLTGLDHVVIRVKDLDAAIESYRKLGLELTETRQTPAIGKQALFSFARRNVHRTGRAARARHAGRSRHRQPW